jgi:hypothetical protein
MSDWSQVTRPIPVPNEWTKPFWDAARRGVLALQRCQACGHFQHPPYPTCIHGLWHIIEGSLQASGRPGERQVKDVNVSFVCASAPIVQGTTPGFSAVLTRVQPIRRW